MSSALPLVSVEWRAPRGVHALVTMRAGGVSNAPMDALNLATHVGDAPEAVAENRRRLRAAAGLVHEPALVAAGARRRRGGSRFPA